MTLRQLFYRLVSAGSLGNRQKEYKRLGTLMTRLREQKQIPLTWIVDHLRQTHKPPSWSGLADFAETMSEVYRKDYWASLPVHVEIFVENDAVAGTIQPITHKYDVRLNVCRGYPSISFAGSIAQQWSEIRKPIHAYYLGDFDPSGFDIERVLCEKLQQYSGRECLMHTWDIDSHQFSWYRVAVQEQDFERHGLIELPVKKKDKRAPAFLEQYGNRCAELDAVPPSVLREHVELMICSHLDGERWGQLMRVEQLEQEAIDQAIEGWETFASGTDGPLGCRSSFHLREDG
jgi:hypothetical protein